MKALVIAAAAAIYTVNGRHIDSGEVDMETFFRKNGHSVKKVGGWTGGALTVSSS